MKAIKINATVVLNNGLTVSSGSCLTIDSANINNKRDFGVGLPIAILTSLYNSETDYNEGKNGITDIKDFNSLFQGSISVVVYETVSTEKMLTDFLIASLTPIYGAANLEVINITPRAV
jgi:hypothetical protein